MNKYRIIVDSCLDFDDELFSENGIFYRVPFGINIDDNNIVDKNINIDELLKKMKGSTGKILSAAPSPQDYMDVYGSSEVNFVITISSKISGSYNSACLARDCFLENNKDSKIYVIDSKSAASGEDLLAYKLKLLLDSSDDYDTIYNEINNIRDNMETFFILEDYSVFVKNGRISNAKAFLIDLLNICPIMMADNGVVGTYKKFRGKMKAYKALVDVIVDRVKNKGKDLLTIVHCAAREKALKIKEEINKLVPNLKIMLLKSGGLSTTYANEGGLIFAI